MKTNLKPFDLKSALNGEPVMLRDGSKAYVRYHETEFSVPFPLIGVLCEDEPCVLTWTLEGLHFADCQTGCDIIGMWPKTRTINGFEVPAPETKSPDIGIQYFAASYASEEFFGAITWKSGEFDNLLLERGLVFLNKEDAIANAKAMLGIDPND